MNILLGVSGSVAAYRAADLARELMRAGHSVRVCLTDSAQKFVTKALFEALTGEPCLESAFEEPIRGRMAHIDWARWANLILIAPATANVLSKLAHGVGDDMLTTIALASTAPILAAPAMNPTMFSSAPVQGAIRLLAARGAVIVEPSEGDVACGERGQGKLASIEQIITFVKEIAEVQRVLEGRKVLITSGPTQEPIDDVRFLSNRSSGRMGAALAHAALLMGGAEVTVVSGPVSIPYPIGCRVIRVQTALEMLEESKEVAKDVELIIGAAAVADYRPEKPASGKMRRSKEAIDLRVVPNPDIIAELVRWSPNAKVVGFAAEPSADLAIARLKVRCKGLLAIAANDISKAGIGFDAEENELTLIFEDGEVLASGRKSKLACALWLLNQIQNHSKTI